MPKKNEKFTFDKNMTREQFLARFGNGVSQPAESTGNAVAGGMKAESILDAIRKEKERRASVVEKEKVEAIKKGPSDFKAARKLEGFNQKPGYTSEPYMYTDEYRNSLGPIQKLFGLDTPIYPVNEGAGVIELLSPVPGGSVTKAAKSVSDAKKLMTRGAYADKKLADLVEVRSALDKELRLFDSDPNYVREFPLNWYNDHRAATKKSILDDIYDNTLSQQYILDNYPSHLSYEIPGVDGPLLLGESKPFMLLDGIKLNAEEANVAKGIGNVAAENKLRFIPEEISAREYAGDRQALSNAAYSRKKAIREIENERNKMDFFADGPTALETRFRTALPDITKSIKDSDINPLFISQTVDGVESPSLAVSEFRKYLQDQGVYTNGISDTDLAKFLTARYNQLTSTAKGNVKNTVFWHSSGDNLDVFDFAANQGKYTGNTGAVGSGNYFSLTGTPYGSKKVGTDIWGMPIRKYSTQPYIINDIDYVVDGYKYPEYGFFTESGMVTPEIIAKDVERARKAPNNMLFYDTKEPHNMGKIELVGDSRFLPNGFALKRNTGVKSIFPHPESIIQDAEGRWKIADTDWNSPYLHFSSGGRIHIKPENRGKFTALKERTGHSATWFKEHGTPAQRKMATFALNARKWKHANGGLLISPEKKMLLDRVNASKADFVQRMKDPNRAFITNPDGSVSTHRMAYVTDGNDAVVYPEIQNIGGNLVEVPGDLAYQSAVDIGDTLHMTPKQAKWFTKKYKKYYPGFNSYDLGGSTADSILYDYFQEQGNPIGDVLLVQPQASVRPAVLQAQPQPFFSSPTPLMRRAPVEPLDLPSESEEAARVVLTTAPSEGRTSGDLLKAYLNTAAKDVPAAEYVPSEDLIQSLIGYEGFLERPSRKIDGKWTIGYGDTDKALNDYYLKNPNKKYSKAEAEKRLRDRVANEFLPELKKSVPNWERLTPQQKDSLLSYAYNVGKYFTSTHKNFVNAMKDFDIVRAAKELNAGWNQRDKSTGKLLYGLRKRRIREQRAFLGDKFSVGGVIDKLKKTYSGDAKSMLEAVRKARRETYEQM